MYFLREVLKKIESTIGTFEPECGGIIAVNHEGIVSDFYFDTDAGYGKASYVPSRLSVQDYIRDNWCCSELKFCGVVHSHPLCNTCEPSYIDIDMALKIMTVNNMDRIYLLMVKGKEIRLYFVTNDNNHKQALCKEELIEVLDF